jgi:hypothetical protein
MADAGLLAVDCHRRTSPPLPATISRMALTVFDIKGVPPAAASAPRPPWSRAAGTRVATMKRGSPPTRSMAGSASSSRGRMIRAYRDVRHR